MKTISLDLRERILAAYDADEGTREEVARRFRVSLGMVKKLLQQRRRLGDMNVSPLPLMVAVFVIFGGIAVLANFSMITLYSSSMAPFSLT